MPRCETTRDQYGTGSSFIDFDREQGSNVFVAQRPLTKGAVLSAIGDTDIPGDVRNPAADLCTTSPPWEEIMKKCLVVPLVGLAISFALPTYAQQKDLADPQTTQKILAIAKAAEEAHNNHDAAAIAALYTRDAVFLTPEGPIIGRQAIQKWYTDDCFSRGTPKTASAQGRRECLSLDRHGWQRTVGNRRIIVRLGKARTGEPIPVKSYWLCIFVREGDDWKIRVGAWDTTPDTVILINKSFAQQPAATPSPTASPSTQ